MPNNKVHFCFCFNGGNATSHFNLSSAFVIVVVVVNAVLVLLLLDGLGCLSKTLDLETLCSLEEGRKLVLSHVNLTGVHEFRDGRQVLEWHILENDDKVLGRVLLQECLEVGRAG